MRYSIVTLMLLFALTGRAQQLNIEKSRQEITSFILAGKLDSARIKAEKLALRSPDGENQLLVGAMFEIQGKKARADSWYQKAALDKAFAKDKLWHDLSFVQLRRGDTAKAISYQRMSLSLNAVQQDLQHSLATLYSSKGKRDSALVYALDAQKAAPGSFDLARIAVDSYWANGEIAKATTHLAQVYQVNKSDSVQIALAYLYYQGEYFEKALPLFSALSQTRPDAEIFYALGKCYERLGNVSKAIAAIEQAIALSSAPNDHFEELLVDLYSWKGDQQQMLAQYVKGSRQKIKGFGDWLQGYQQTVELANQSYAKLESTTQANAAAEFLSLAKGYVHAKDYRTGLAVIDDYKLTATADADSVRMLSIVAFMGLKQFDKAKQELLLLMKDSSNPDYNDLMLAICYQLRDYQGLVSFYEQRAGGAFSIDKDLKEKLLFIAYSQLGNTTKAKTYWKQ